jgi:ankyrin repeat protein
MKIVGLWLAMVGCLLTSEAAPNSSITPEYLSTLREGNVRKLRAALDQGASPKARDAAGNTPLILAALYADASCVRLLLDRGAEVNATNAAGATALMRAATDYEKVRLLVDRGANVHTRSASGNTALLLAARPANSLRIVELLLARGADAKATNDSGASALMAAAAGGDVQSARLLLKHGAAVNDQPAPNEAGFIFGGARSPLMWAAFRGDIAMLKLLLEAGADVNAMGGLGTALAQAAWADRTAAAKLLLDHGARVDMAGPRDGYTALHWAASTEERDAALVKLLLNHKANPNLGGGDPVDAFLDVSQTPLMLATRRGDTAVRALLTSAGATNFTPDNVPVKTPPARQLPARLDAATLRTAIARATPPLQKTSLYSKKSFLNHASRQDCTSCHSQYLPLAAIGFAKKLQVAIDEEAEEQLVKIIRAGELKSIEPDLQALFHPDAVYTKGYELFGFAGASVAADENTDAWVHHLSAIQGRDGQWFNNLPRPPLQTGDIGATALAVHALTRYPLPGRQAEFTKQVERARQWLRTAQPQNQEGRVYQLLGLAWAGESTRKLQASSKALLAEQRSDGGWAQLPGLKSDAYATGQALYALRIGAGMKSADPAIARGLRYLLENQLADGTWYVRRRAFPFQPTMNSGFPHGRDSWISTAATSWAVLALGVSEDGKDVAMAK